MTQHEHMGSAASDGQHAASSGRDAGSGPGAVVDAVQPASGRGRRSRRAGPRGLLVDVVVVLVGALVMSAFVRHVVAQVFEIPSTSMTNTLVPGDRVVVSRLSDVHRGDVVVFKDPGGWLEDEHGSTRGWVGRSLEGLGLLPSTSSDHLVKRLVGMPGDHVVCCDARGRVTVNGQPLDERSYLWVNPATGLQDAPARRPFDVVVPAGHAWVMGDHRSGSRDSRCHLQDVTTAGGPSGTNAFVPLDDVVGPAFAIVGPVHRIRRLRAPSTFDSVPPASAPAPADAVITTAGDCQG